MLPVVSRVLRTLFHFLFNMHSTAKSFKSVQHLYDFVPVLFGISSTLRLWLSCSIFFSVFYNIPDLGSSLISSISLYIQLLHMFWSFEGPFRLFFMRANQQSRNKSLHSYISRRTIVKNSCKSRLHSPEFSHSRRKSLILEKDVANNSCWKKNIVLTLCQPGMGPRAKTEIKSMSSKIVANSQSFCPVITYTLSTLDR